MPVTEETQSFRTDTKEELAAALLDAERVAG